MLTRRTVLSTAAIAAMATGANASGKLIYSNALRAPSDIKDFVLEGSASVEATPDGMVLKNALDPALGQASNFVLWCPEVFPDNVDIRWKFTAIEEPGLCILFFAARGLLGGSEVHVLDKGLKPRAGIYDQYTQSDVSALQIAYFRRRWPEERAFHVCNLRRAPGFEMLATGPDPLPDVKDMTPPYKLRLIKQGRRVSFSINDLPVIGWEDREGSGQFPTSGSLGFRQMAPLIACYADLEVYSL